MDIRLKTFENYTGPANKEKLARNGFLYNQDKAIECFACGCTYSKWTKDDDPEKIHADISPFCKFRIALAENPSDVENCNKTAGVVQYSEFISHSSRLKTFDGSKMNLPFNDLASAGLIHLGPQDQVMCYACGGVLAQWPLVSDPWTEHMKKFPECYHLSITLGKENMKTPQETTSYNVNICKICFKNPMSFCVFPCGHVLACPKCADSIVKCCICLKEVTSKRRIYYS